MSNQDPDPIYPVKWLGGLIDPRAQRADTADLVDLVSSADRWVTDHPDSGLRV